MGDAIFGGIIGLVVGFIMAGFMLSHSESQWEITSVAHGYAHYNIDNSWHWNNEKPQ